MNQQAGLWLLFGSCQEKTTPIEGWVWHLVEPIASPTTRSGDAGCNSVEVLWRSVAAFFPEWSVP
jgi:hypothetical protein